jgi:hypothetical protein
MKNKLLSMFLLIGFLFSANQLFAGSLGDFHAKLNDAYGQYRKALVLTNKKKQQESMKALKGFDSAMNALSDEYLSSPPAPYNESPLWKGVLSEISEINAKAMKELEANKIHESHVTLEKTRALLSSLRKSVGIRTFSDWVNDYHHAMELLVRKKYGTKKLDDSVIMEIREKLAVMSYLMHEVKAYAPESYSKNSKFQTILKGNLTLMDMLQDALVKKDEAKIKSLLKKVKPAYAKLFINFG